MIAQVCRSAASALGVALFSAAGAPLAAAARDGGFVSLTLPLAAGSEALGATLADVDGDGRDDLVLAVAREDARELRAHLGTAGSTPFAAEPHWRLALPADVVAFALGDVLPPAGAEPVLLSASGVFAAQPLAPEDRRFERLAAAPVLWQLGRADQLPHYGGLLRDLDGDGLLDLLVPTASGYSAFVQRRAEGKSSFEAAGDAVLPDAEALAAERGVLAPEESQAAPRGTLRARLGVTTGGGTLLSVSDVVPAPFVVPFAAPGKLALLALDDRFLHVWPVGGGGALAAQPEHSLLSPVQIDQRRRLDVSYAAVMGDLDGDGREDLVLVAGDQRSSDVRTQVLVFTHGAAPAGEAPLFGDAGRPTQVLVLAGFVGNVRLLDVDGDRNLDLVATAVRPDLLESLRQATSDRVEADLYVYRGEGNGRFARRPNLTRRLRFAVQDADPMVRFAAAPSPRGPALLVTREEPTSVVGSWVRTSRDGSLEVIAEPLWRMGLDPKARVLLLGPLGGDTVVAIEASQVRVGRWR